MIFALAPMALLRVERSISEKFGAI